MNDSCRDADSRCFIAAATRASWNSRLPGRGGLTTSSCEATLWERTPAPASVWPSARSEPASTSNPRSIGSVGNTAKPSRYKTDRCRTRKSTFVTGLATTSPFARPINVLGPSSAPPTDASTAGDFWIRFAWTASSPWSGEPRSWSMSCSSAKTPESFSLGCNIVTGSISSSTSGFPGGSTAIGSPKSSCNRRHFSSATPACGRRDEAG